MSQNSIKNKGCVAEIICEILFLPFRFKTKMSKPFLIQIIETKYYFFLLHLQRWNSGKAVNDTICLMDNKPAYLRGRGRGRGRGGPQPQGDGHRPGAIANPIGYHSKPLSSNSANGNVWSSGDQNFKAKGK